MDNSESKKLENIEESLLRLEADFSRKIAALQVDILESTEAIKGQISELRGVTLDRKGLPELQKTQLMKIKLP